jgi:hypothetical protein
MRRGIYGAMKIQVLCGLLLSSSFFAFAAQASSEPMCNRVSVMIQADDADYGAQLKGIQGFIVRKLREHGYHAKYVTFYAPGEPIPASNEAQISADAGDEDRVSVLVDYSDLLIQRNVGLRIYKIAAKPPYHSLPYYNGNVTIGPLRLLGARLKDRIRQLVGAKEMVQCGQLATMAPPSN